MTQKIQNATEEDVIAAITLEAKIAADKYWSQMVDGNKELALNPDLRGIVKMSFKHGYLQAHLLRLEALAALAFSNEPLASSQAAEEHSLSLQPQSQCRGAGRQTPSPSERNTQ